jgi:hypothetical protein
VQISCLFLFFFFDVFEGVEFVAVARSFGAMVVSRVEGRVDDAGVFDKRVVDARFVDGRVDDD